MPAPVRNRGHRLAAYRQCSTDAGEVKVGEHAWALAGVAVGWLMSEFGQYWRLRRDDRRAFGRALAHALEVQRQLVLLCKLASDDTFMRMVDADRQALLESIREAIERIDSARTKFEDVVDLVAAVNPLLGARLRNCGTYSTAHFVKAVGALNLPSDAFLRMRPFLASMLEDVSRVVSQLAWRHGLLTWGWLKVRHGRRGPELAAVLAVSRL